MNTSVSVSPKAIALVAALLVGLIAGWFIVIGPKRHEASRLAQQIDDTRTQIAAAEGSGSTSQAPQIRVADLFELSRAMPDTADIPSVLLELSQISAETGVTFQSITPHDPVSAGSYESIGIDLVFQGHFYDLSDFLYRLRNLVGVHQGVLSSTGRLFTVDSIAFDEGELKFPQVKATLTVSAYVFGDGSGDPVPAGATGSEAAPSAAAPTSTTPVSSLSPTSTTPESSQPIPAEPPNATAAGA